MRTAITLLGLFMFSSAFTQSEEDALRLSTTQPGGTARSMGLGNAFGALGADGGSIGINPAGMGLYRTSELSMTIGLESNSATGIYLGTEAQDSQTRFIVNNFTLALHTVARKSTSAWKSSTFGMAYDRQSTQNYRRRASSERVSTSILDDLAARANGTLANDLFNVLPYTSGLAYDTYGIDPTDPADTLGRTYVAALPVGAAVAQKHAIDSRGSTRNTSFFYSGNYMDQLYIGASIGIVGFRYSSTTVHEEKPVEEAVNLQELRFQEDLTTSGNGLEVKLGAVVRFSDHFRGGFAFHSPMWVQLSDVYVTRMNTSFNTPPADGTGATFDQSSPDGVFNYRINTPWSGVVSAAYIAGSNGLISVDYTYMDQRNARLRASNKVLDPYDFEPENRVIQSSFRPVHSVRIGTEWRKQNWYVRFGWGYIPDAYAKGNIRQGDASQTYAGGIGYRTDHIALDLGLDLQRSSLNYYQYDPFFAPITQEERSNFRSLLTFSFRP